MALACAPEPTPGRSVVATVHPLALLAAELGGDRIRVATLVPGGASPHSFEPRPSDVARLERAHTLLRVGAGLDDWTKALLAAAPASLAVWTLADVPGLLDPARAGEAPDPHVWLDPVRVRERVAPALSLHLQQLDPADVEGYRARLAQFSARLVRLDAEIVSQLGSAHELRYVAIHPGWHHFAARYGLEEVGIVHGPALEEPTPRALARLLDRARRLRPQVVLIEPQLDPRLGELLAAEFHARVVLVDPLGDPDAAGSSYPGLLLAAARALAAPGTPR